MKRRPIETTPQRVNQPFSQGKNEYFPQQPCSALHDTFDRQTAEIEFWIETHQAPCMYGYASASAGTCQIKRISNGPPSFIERHPNYASNNDDIEGVARVQVLVTSTNKNIAHDRPTKIDNSSMHIDKNHMNKAKAIVEQKTAAVPLIFVDDKSHLSEKSSVSEVKHSLDTSKENNITKQLIDSSSNESPNIDLFVNHPNNLKKSDPKMNGNSGDINKNIESNKSLLFFPQNTIFSSITSTPKIKNGINNCQNKKKLLTSTKSFQVNKKTTSPKITPINKTSASNYVDVNILNKTMKITCKSNVRIKKDAENILEYENMICHGPKESPNVTPGNSNAVKMTSREIFDDSDASVLTAPYIRSTRNNTSKSRYQNLSRQRACHSKIRNYSTGCDLRKICKKTDIKCIVGASIGLNINESVNIGNSNDTLHNIMTPNDTNAISYVSNSSSQVSSRRARMLHFTPFSTAPALPKTNLKPKKMPRKLLSQSCEVGDLCVERSGEAGGNPGGKRLPRQSRMCPTEDNKVPNALLCNDVTPAKKKKFFA